MNRLLFPWLTLGFLDASILYIYIAGPESFIMLIVGAMFFFISALTLTFWRADRQAEITRKQRESWENGNKEEPAIRKRKSKNSGIMFLETGCVSVCFLGILIQMLLKYEFPLEMFLFFAAFLTGATIVCMVQGIRRIRTA